ncbi:S8 family serine peptidase [Paraburkholderia bonniea]|uniref:S8 family serine peptidase n=1 Tax=Paraburkholderia bonniea TaxID=2152891 RepID=UPI001FE6644B|nr:S8 family serine peptidase [Paraburkholderia bonniea]WJF90122.1 S8 family serine peptidase [Paraburkholderia bonniea]WJF93436.1 S8 family serine peptidase [Paraburkholderia bonniea]
MAYACKTGSTEPLYTYQWALKLIESFFSAFSTAKGGSDLNVEPAHLAGIKGQNVRALVLDSGIDVNHEDLAANVDAAMTYLIAPDDIAHGTGVAGIIGAAQNGKGVMGIAPRVILGGTNFFTYSSPTTTEAYGGAPWSSSADLINASYGVNPYSPPSFETDSASAEQTAIRAFPNLRGGKGLVYLKAAGNEFNSEASTRRDCPAGVQGALSCENPAHDTETLESNVISVAAANANGMKSSYSSVGSVNWITGLGGEFANGGSHGQSGTGPTIFSTDLVGCSRGSSENTSSLSASFIDFRRGVTVRDGKKENANCDYSMLNGTSAATPTISGVVSLMLSANPKLTWRDVREILRATARKIDPTYGERSNRNMLLDLTSGTFTSTKVGGSADLMDGTTTARVEYGWQTNGAGYAYSNAYGFGLADAAAAVTMAKNYTSYRSAALNIPAFSNAFPPVTSLNYGRVTRLGTINVSGAGQVDALQLRLSGPLCVGSVGVFVKSPAGTVSALSVPYNIYYKTGDRLAKQYGLSSYAFFGEAKAGTWEVFLVSGTPIASAAGACLATPSAASPLTVEYRILGRV